MFPPIRIAPEKTGFWWKCLAANAAPLKTGLIFCENLRDCLHHTVMKKLSAIIFITCAFLKLAQGQTNAPKRISPDSAQFSSAPGMAGVQASWLVGAAGNPGLYTLR